MSESSALQTARSDSSTAAAHARFSAPRVAIVHYWLVGMRGGERVIERMLKLFPNADIFTHVYDPNAMSSSLRDARVQTTFIDRLPFARKAYRYYLPLMPMALESLDLTGYDLVISSESGPAKGVITGPDSLHVCYTHSPMRYLWDHYHQYKREMNPLVRLAMPSIYHRMRQWDASSSARVDKFAANSTFVRNRIRKSWRREAEVIHPPVEISLFTPSLEVDDYFLWLGEMVPYKRPDIAVEAFNRTGRKLLMVGTGGMRKRLEAIAKPNITFVDRLNFADLRKAYARCRALIFTAEEDFGIVPVEAMASGRPVIAYAGGGVRDTVVPDVSGRVFAQQTGEALAEAVEDFEKWLPNFDVSESVRTTKRFAPERFDAEMLRITQV